MRNKIAPNDFQSLIQPLIEVWPEFKTPARAKRCYNAICDLEPHVVKDIINNFLDSRSKMPLPSDFLDANKMFKKQFFEKTGRFYGSNKGPPVTNFFEPACRYCFDSGFEWVEVEGVSAFCFCFCKEGDNQRTNSDWLFPKASELAQVKRKVFPLAAFIPKEKSGHKVDKEFYSVMLRFRAALKDSQNFWSNYSSDKLW